MRKWNDSYRGGDDRCKYRTGHVTDISGSDMEQSGSEQLWNDSFEEAKELVTTDIETNIQGYDIDGEIIRAAVTMQSVPVWII